MVKFLKRITFDLIEEKINPSNEKLLLSRVLSDWKTMKTKKNLSLSLSLSLSLHAQGVFQIQKQKKPLSDLPVINAFVQP
jgi:hypothetical protein